MTLPDDGPISCPSCSPRCDWALTDTGRLVVVHHSQHRILCISGPRWHAACHAALAHEDHKILPTLDLVFTGRHLAPRCLGCSLSPCRKGFGKSCPRHRWYASLTCKSNPSRYVRGRGELLVSLCTMGVPFLQSKKQSGELCVCGCKGTFPDHPGRTLISWRKARNRFAAWLSMAAIGSTRHEARLKTLRNRGQRSGP